MIDLSHAYASDTLYWPTDTTGFRLDTLAEGQAPGGYFYAAKQFATAEHGGTHLDAPNHFADGGDDAASIPLDRLILPGIVIDVSEAAAANPDYLVTVEDVTAWEEEHGRVPAGSAVLIRTGWATRWPDALAYLGDDTPGETGNLHFPGIGEAATRLLGEERRAGLLGIDTASIDNGQSTDFIAHQIGGGGRRSEPGERRGFVRVAADRVPAGRAADEDRGRHRRAGADRCADPDFLMSLAVPSARLL